MKLGIEELVKGLEILTHVPQRAGLRSSEFVRWDQKKDSAILSLASDVFGEVRIPVQEAMKLPDFFIERASLFPFIFAGREETGELDVSLKNDAMILKKGNRKATFSNMGAIDGYPKLKPEEGVKITLPADQRTLLSLASRYASTDASLPHLNCTYIDGKSKYICATNQLCVFAAETTVTKTAAIPLLLSQVLAAKQDGVCYLYDAMVEARFDNGYVCEMLSEKCRTDFPAKNLETLMESAGAYQKRFSLPAGVLSPMCKRLKDYVAGSASVSDIMLEVSGVAGKSSVQFRTQAQQGHFQESVPVKNPCKGDFKVEWLLSFALPFLEYFASDNKARVSVSFDKQSPYLLTSGTVRLLLPRMV